MPQQRYSLLFRRMQWRMLLITMFCYLFFYTGRHNFGWAARDMAEDLGISYEKIGWISFAMLIGYALGQFINGNLADRYSPRKLIITGGLLSIIMNFGISFSGSFTAILVLWCCNGFFQSMAWAPGSRLISNWWRAEERGVAFGLYTMAAGASSVVTYLLSILLIHADQSWPSLFRVPVMFLLGALVLFFLVARDKPSAAGFPDLLPAAASAPQDWKSGYAKAFGNSRFLLVCLSIGFQSMARYGLIFWVPVYFLGAGYKNDPHLIWISLLLPVGMSLGAFSFGQIADKIFRGNKIVSIMAGMCCCSGVSFLIYLLPVQHGVTAGILIFLSGFFAYGPQANFWPLCPELLGEKYIGTGVGIMNMTAYLFAAIGEPVMGKIIDSSGNTATLFLAVSVIALFSGLIIPFAALPGKRLQTAPDTDPL